MARSLKRKVVLKAAVAAVTAAMPLLSGSAESAPGADLFALGLEELMQVEVTTVARQPEHWFDTPAAVYVITSEEIRRSGATTIPEVLRLAPGVQVVRMDANKWAISARGLNGRFARYMLVMIDGRSVYHPLYSGVMWELQDLMLEDIERIEVIRGPGGTLWGANAVNGIVNIVTKSAEETQGGLAGITAGTEERINLRTRYGGRIDSNTFYRVYAKGFERDLAPVGGDEGHDDWRMGRGGFRMDWTGGEADRFMMRGDYYRGLLGQSVTSPDPAFWPFPVTREDAEDARVSGGDLLFRWTRTPDITQEFQLQTFIDHRHREESTLEMEVNTFDLDVQHQLRVSPRRERIWGFGYRLVDDDLDESFSYRFDEESRTTQLFSGFIQEQYELRPDALTLSLGTKLEHNDYTGFEWQPGARLAWTPTDRDTWWASVTRAVRTPARVEHDWTLRQVWNGVPLVIRGNSDYGTEDLVAWELGYRTRPHENVMLDIATFYFDYDEMQSLQLVDTGPPAVLDIDNRVRGESYGFETSARWDVCDRWTLDASYSFIEMHLHPEEGSNDPFTENFENDVPQNMAHLLSTVDLTERLAWDAWLRYTGNINNYAGYDIDPYLTMDTGLRWQVNDRLNLAVVGRNLLEPAHREYASSLILNSESTEVERSVYVRATWTF
ncbi:TonB-dependent receptor plug domain-containing protein [Kiritimatiella glycovorans]|uniref:Colicin I receptor n=1 Tax=Kiritimatiella glycovorans TaxID=1307763 RepID=A0A0G3EEZ3_9BACT|nr:TonB-dependent receptor [Kiritimatiella glycovorans]AKJ64893.1 Colicin I receptor precursor [Kiritimatiella glycovorans]